MGNITMQCTCMFVKYEKSPVFAYTGLGQVRQKSNRYRGEATAIWAAANRAIGTRNGEQLT